MVAKIGQTAGQVFHYLAEHGEVSYAVLRKNVIGKEQPMPDVLLSAAIGWLAREGKVRLGESGSGRGYRVRVGLNA